MSVRHVVGWSLVGIGGLGAVSQLSGDNPEPRAARDEGIPSWLPWVGITAVGGGGLWMALGDQHPKLEAEKGSARLRSGQLLGRSADRAARRSGRR
jgi:hypothetical protein